MFVIANCSTGVATIAIARLAPLLMPIVAHVVIVELSSIAEELK